MIALSNLHYILIAVSAINAVASLQRMGRVWLVGASLAHLVLHAAGLLIAYSMFTEPGNTRKGGS